MPRVPIYAAAFNQGVTPTISFVNQATVPLGVDLTAMVAAFTKILEQPNIGFVDVWGTPAKLVAAAEIVPQSWAMMFLDDADEANALGYHDLTPDGLPLSKVFVKTTLGAGEEVAVTASHELFEMLVDPAINMWAMHPNGTMYAYEMSDAVEAEVFQIDGVPISDFVYPSYFEGFRQPGSVKFDYLGKVRRPFQILKGGYSIIHKGGRISQIFGSAEKAEAFAQEDRRMHRSEYRVEKAVRGRQKDTREEYEIYEDE